MITYIDTGPFICSVLDAHPECDVIDFRTMRKIIDHVEKRLSHLSVCFEWTRNGVCDLEHSYRSTFVSLKREFDNIGYRKPYTHIDFTSGYNKAFLEELKQAILEVEIEVDPSDTKTVFVSGHLNLTEEEFKLHYAKKITIAYRLGHTIVIGDAGGCDEMAQRFLNTLTKSRSKIFVYHMLDKARNNPCGYPVIGGFKSDNSRDKAMTEASDYDIAWCRKGIDKSGTAKNILRRKPSQMKVFTPEDNISEIRSKSIFLAGPTPRSADVKSWRPEALDYLRRTGFDGDVLVPEVEGSTVQLDYCNQVKWELEGMGKCSVILFWVPRNTATMPAFTTNVEFGMYIKSNKIVYGRPDTAENIRYLDVLYKEWQGTPFNELEQTLNAADKLTKQK